jgi:hypothetical protein
MTDPEVGFSDRLSHPSRLKLGALVGGSLAIIVSAAVAMGASPAPSTSSGTGADASAAPGGASTWPGRDGDFDGLGRFENFGGRFAFGGITITAIEGSNLTLKTEDGWTRTIAVTDATAITRAGAAIKVGDLAVGDQIRFSQTRNADGTFSIGKIAVVLPHVLGEVTATSANSITVKARDGSSVTVHVDGNTDYVVGGDDGATLSDVTVGMQILAAGEKNADGSLDATQVRAGDGFRGGRGHHWDGDKSDGAGPSAAPDGSTNDG